MRKQLLFHEPDNCFNAFCILFGPVLCLDVMGDGREEETAGEGRAIRK